MMADVKSGGILKHAVERQNNWGGKWYELCDIYNEEGSMRSSQKSLHNGVFWIRTKEWNYTIKKISCFGAWLAKFGYFSAEILKLQDRKPSPFSLILKPLILRLKVNLKYIFFQTELHLVQIRRISILWGRSSFSFNAPSCPPKRHFKILSRELKKNWKERINPIWWNQESLEYFNQAWHYRCFKSLITSIPLLY